MKIYYAIPLLLVMALLFNGCVTAALLNVGRHIETPAGIQEARLLDEAIVLVYGVKIDGGRQEKRWTSLPFGRVEETIRDRKKFGYGAVKMSELDIHDEGIPTPITTKGTLFLMNKISSKERIQSHLPESHPAICVSDEWLGTFYLLNPRGNEPNDFVECSIGVRTIRHPASYFFIVPAMPFAALWDALICFPYMLMTNPRFT